MAQRGKRIRLYIKPISDRVLYSAYLFFGEKKLCKICRNILDSAAKGVEPDLVPVFPSVISMSSKQMNIYFRITEDAANWLEMFPPMYRTDLAEACIVKHLTLSVATADEFAVIQQGVMPQLVAARRGAVPEIEQAPFYWEIATIRPIYFSSALNRLTAGKPEDFKQYENVPGLRLVYPSGVSVGAAALPDMAMAVDQQTAAAPEKTHEDIIVNSEESEEKFIDQPKPEKEEQTFPDPYQEDFIDTTNTQESEEDPDNPFAGLAGLFGGLEID